MEVQTLGFIRGGEHRAVGSAGPGTCSFCGCDFVTPGNPAAAGPPTRQTCLSQGQEPRKPETSLKSLLLLREPRRLTTNRLVSRALGDMLGGYVGRGVPSGPSSLLGQVTIRRLVTHVICPTLACPPCPRSSSGRLRRFQTRDSGLASGRRQRRERDGTKKSGAQLSGLPRAFRLF